MAGAEFSAEQVAAAVRDHRLLSMEVEMTHRCNLRCVYCYADAGAPLPNEMSREDILRGIDQGIRLGARKIVILGGGEPCLYPHLRELIDHMHRAKVDIELFSNGTLMTRSLAEYLFERRVAVVVKRNALDPAVQDRLAGVPGTLERIERGLAFLLAAGYPDAQHGLGIETVICRANLGQLPDLWRWARTGGILPYFECITTQGRARRAEGLSVSAAELHEAFQTLSDIDRREFGIEWSPHPPLAASRCARHLYSILIKADGTVYPCVGVEINLGNIVRDSLESIILSHPVVHDLRNIYQKIKGRCRTCRLNGECYGCRGNAFQRTGDYLAPDPGCWLSE